MKLTTSRGRRRATRLILGSALCPRRAGCPPAFAFMLPVVSTNGSRLALKTLEGCAHLLGLREWAATPGPREVWTISILTVAIQLKATRGHRSGDAA